ncbi:hypothetical protein PanWU01x14_328660 [Parasponia andersonii]|uniref:Uncharacterized protein n=1 Tax=Parasponia andersonii TaxID=3476 RepID=A0A2P5AIP4_PARAD|nr:hypothetical protein PanWU01x14_328660 [Parasponia andersonii]
MTRFKRAGYVSRLHIVRRLQRMIDGKRESDDDDASQALHLDQVLLWSSDIAKTNKGVNKHGGEGSTKTQGRRSSMKHI